MGEGQPGCSMVVKETGTLPVEMIIDNDKR